MRRLAGIGALAAACVLFATPPAFPAEPDYRGYERLLERYLARIERNRELLRSGFDYRAFHARAGDQRAGAVLDRIRRDLLGVPPSRMTRPERLAWGINLYNFLVIQSVVEEMEKRGGPIESVRDVEGFFERPVVEVEGASYSLDALERRFLFEGFDPRSGDPPASLDPRIHFVLVCAARGCPPLHPRAYRARTLDAELDRATRSALGTPDHLALDTRGDTLSASAIFEWYEADFGGRARAFEFLKRYAPLGVRLGIGTHRISSIGRTIPWDWRLNQPGAWLGAPGSGRED